MSEIILTKENFEAEISQEKPILVDFWAEWCGPCKMLGPVISEIAEEMADTIRVGKVNVDEQQELASKFGIASIPTVIIFKNGKAEKTMIGFRPKGDVLDFINS